MEPMLQIVLETEVARHKRELSEAFARLREEWSPPPRHVGDLSWRAAQMAMNDAARRQRDAIGMIPMVHALMSQAQMADMRPSTNPLLCGFAGSAVLSGLAGPGYNAAAHAAASGSVAYPGL